MSQELYVEKVRDFKNNFVKSMIYNLNYNVTDIYDLRNEFYNVLLDLGFSFDERNSELFRNVLKDFGIFGLHTKEFCKGFVDYYGKKCQRFRSHVG